MSLRRDDVKTFSDELTPEREALLTPNDFEMCDQPLTPPSTVVLKLSPIFEGQSGSRVGNSVKADVGDTTSGRPLSRLQLARDRLKRSVIGDVDPDGVSKVNSIITHRDRSIAHKIGDGDEVIVVRAGSGLFRHEQSRLMSAQPDVSAAVCDVY